MFSYVTETHYNDYVHKHPHPHTKKPSHPYNYKGVFTYTWPKENEPNRLSFKKHYEIKDESFYRKDYEENDLKQNFASNYSIVFINENSDNNNIPFIQTNKNQVDDMYMLFNSWNPRKFDKVSVPPRSKIYLFMEKEYNGKFLKFENKTDHSYIYSFRLSEIDGVNDENIQSFKWITEFPIKLFYVLEEGIEIYRPIKFISRWDLSEERKQINSPMNAPLYESSVSDYKYTKYNNLHNT